MLTHSIIVQNASAIVLKTIQTTMSFTKTYYQYTYKICLLETGSWYKLDVNPYLDEQDDLAIAKAELITRSPDEFSLMPALAGTAETVRDFYLRTTHDDNFVMFDYREHSIWFGYNDGSKTGYYFITDSDGEDWGTSHESINEAKELIDENC